jgi:hypothetical protein
VSGGRMDGATERGLRAGDQIERSISHFRWIQYLAG